MTATQTHFDQSLHEHRILAKMSWVNKSFNLNYVRGTADSILSKRDRLPSERYITIIRDAWELLEQIYPGRGDIQFRFEPHYKRHVNQYGSNLVNEFQLFDRVRVTAIYIMIHFPEIIIHNDNEGEHTIKDLYVRIPIEVNWRADSSIRRPPFPPVFNTIQGTRSTVSVAELESQYLHSHLPSMIMSRGLSMNFNEFCTGVGDIVHATSLLNNMYTKEGLELLLLEIDPFVRWESLEGGPHIRMESIALKDYTVNEPAITDCIGLYNKLLDSIKYYDFPLELNWRFQNGRYEIIDDSTFEDYFRRRLAPYVSNTTFFLNKDEKGEYYAPPSYNESVTRESENWIPFRNNKIRFKAEGEFKRVDKVRYIHPKIKNYVKQHFEQFANKAKIREIALTK